MNVEDKVLSIVASQVGIQAKEISLEDTTKTLCMDSLDKIETLMALEEEFDIEINDHQAEKFITVQDIVDFIKVNQVYNQMSKESYNAAKEVFREEYNGKTLHDVVTKPLYNPVKNISREKYQRCTELFTSSKLFRSNRNGSCLWMHLSKCGKYYYWCEYNSKNDIIYFRGEVDWVESNYDDYDQVSKDDVIVSFDSDGVVGDCKWDSRELGCDEEYVSTVELPEADEYTGSITEWTDKHYDFSYTLTGSDIKKGVIKIDPYFVAKQWKIGSKDDSGALFHSFKLFARWAEKNSFEREVVALYKQTKRMAELYNIDLGE